MGTKRPSCTLFDTSSSINMSDRKLQPGGKVSRDPSPRPGMTAQSQREREEDWRRERDMEKMRDKARYKDMDPRERYYERDRGPAPRPREGEREWREREKRKENDKSRNGRPLSNVEKETERETERGMMKGDTFPRMTKSSADYGKNRTSAADEMDEERGHKKQRDRPRRTDRDDDERERAWQRERYRDDDLRGRPKEERKNFGEDKKSRHGERYHESDAGFHDKRRDKNFEVGDSWDRRERDATRKGEKPYLGGRDPRMPSPYRRREREMYSDRKEMEKTHKKVKERGTRSEGDMDEREVRQERQRDRERDEFMHQQSQSEGDNKSKTMRQEDHYRQGYREDRQRHRDREADRSRRGSGDRRRRAEKDRDRYREEDRRAGRESERCIESVRDSKDDRGCDKREDDRYRGTAQRKGRERQIRGDDPRLDDPKGRSSRSSNEVAPRAPPRAQSSGEWSSDMDSEVRYRRGRYEERESGRGSAADSERDVEDKNSPERAAERRRRQQIRSGRQERDRKEVAGNVPEQRRMWLEPQRGKSSKESSLEEEFVEGRGEEEWSTESQTEWGREGRRVKPDERFLERSPYRGNEGRTQGGRLEHREQRGDRERETEGVSVDGEEEEEGEVWRELDRSGNELQPDSDRGTEGRWQSDEEGDNVTNNTEKSDREKEGGSDYCARSESEGGSETGWGQDRDRMLSGEDGFVTLSSSGDEEQEKEEDEEEFVDCQDYWEGGDAPSSVGFKSGEGDEGRDGELKMGKDKTVDEEEHGGDNHPPYVFCVIGQTLPRSMPHPMDGEERHNLNVENHDVAQQREDDLQPTRSGHAEYLITSKQETEAERAAGEPPAVHYRRRLSSEPQDTETREGATTAEHPFAEIGARDSQTDRLLIEWRQRNKELAERAQVSPVPSNPYGDVGSQVTLEQILPTLDGINVEAMSPEEKEAILIRLSGAWSMSEEPKRHSQAPHLKWAKNVVREILGHSEEHTLDDPNSERRGNQRVNQSEAAINEDTEPEEVPQRTGEVPLYKLRPDDHHPEPELEEEEPLEVEGLRGMGQSQRDMHADQSTAMHADTPTHTHSETVLDTDRKDDQSSALDTETVLHLEKPDTEVTLIEQTNDEAQTKKETSREKEVEMYLSVSNTLYKPNSCPILNYKSESDLLVPCNEGDAEELEDRVGEGGKQELEPEERGAPDEIGTGSLGEETEVDNKEGAVISERKMVQGTLTSSCSFRDLGPEARLRRRGIRKTTERRHEELVEVEEEEGVGRDRRPRIFSTTDDEDDRSKSWGEVELRNVLDTLGRRRRNSKFFNAAQLYQQYSEAAQNFEILRQSRSDVLSVSEDPTPSPGRSPPPARRPLPPLPPVPHPHSLSHTGSITSVKSLPLPELPKRDGRPTSPRLSISLTQSATLWRELPGVRNSTELEELTEDKRRLQEVRFEVLTSEASYCRSLDIVVEHFVKSKQLGALLATQDRNWLFSRLADVRAISHSFLSKLEERLESDIMYFTVCDIIARHCQRFKMVYVPYLTNQSYQDATYQRLMNENPGFKRIVEKLERSPVCQRLPLRSFLVLPFQRITRIKLLVQNIVKRTVAGTAEATQAIKALKLLEKLIQESNDSITQMKSIESLVSLSAKVDFECRTLPLISQSRRLVREGLVTELMDFSLKDTERNVYLHLFNDYLLVSQHKEGGRFTVIDHAPVSELRAENCRVKLHSLQKNLFRLHTSHKALLLRTDTQSDKLRWISALSRPHPEIDFSSAQDFPQMQCIRAFVSQQPDELSLEKADILLVHQQSSDRWVEGTRLSDRQRGWVPESHLELISNSRVQERNLLDALKLTTATATV